MQAAVPSGSAAGGRPANSQEAEASDEVREQGSSEAWNVNLNNGNRNSNHVGNSNNRALCVRRP
jgi:hypothetical protein